jgi:hypothetical protein
MANEKKQSSDAASRKNKPRFQLSQQCRSVGFAAK